MQINLAGRQERYNEPAYNNNASGTGNIYSQLLYTRPNKYPVFNPDGTYGSYQNANGGGNENLYGLAVDRGYQFKDTRHMSFDLTINQRMDFLLNGLYVEASGSYYSATSYYTMRRKDFVAYWYNEDGAYQQKGSDGGLS